jgi:hypothetical protein
MKKMHLKFSQKKEDEVPQPGASGKINQDLLTIRDQMAKLASGMVLEIETEGEKAVRGTKMLVTRAANQLGTRWQHWNVGSKVFAKPADAIRRRGRRKKTE